MFIYTTDKKTRDALLKAGFRFIIAKEQESENNTVWAFVNDETVPIPDFVDKKNYVLSKKMSF